MVEEPKNALGIPMGDATSPDNQFRWVAPASPGMDWAAKALADAQDNYYKKFPNVSRNGHVWRLPTLK